MDVHIEVVAAALAPVWLPAAILAGAWWRRRRAARRMAAAEQATAEEMDPRRRAGELDDEDIDDARARWV